MTRIAGIKSGYMGKVKGTLKKGRRGSALTVRNMIPGSIGPTILKIAFIVTFHYSIHRTSLLTLSVVNDGLIRSLSSILFLISLINTISGNFIE